RPAPAARDGAPPGGPARGPPAPSPAAAPRASRLRSSPAAMPASAAVASGHFIGRERELHDLQERWTRACDGRGGLVLLVGEAGIGKTRTAEELVARAGVAERAVLWGRCPEHEGAPAFWPWVQALRRQATQSDPAVLREDLGAAALDVARVIPGIRDRLPELPASGAVDVAEAQFRIFDAIAEWLR